MPYRYTHNEYLNMVTCYRDSNYSAAGASRLYAQRYNTVVNPQTIYRAHQRFHDGNLMPVGEAGRPRYPVRLEVAILDFFDRHPMSSTRDAANVFNVSDVYVWKILKREGKHPYHFTRVQELQPQDYEPRVIFSQWIIRNARRNVLWTDECTFARVGLFNIHNAHFWSEQNPHLARPDHFQTRFSVNVWAGLLGDYLLGPVFLNRLNGRTYLQFLQEGLPELLDEVPVDLRRRMYFQHDGAPAHYDRNVRRYLTERFQLRWIGRGGVQAGAVNWPARSPDLTPLDFHVWGRAKDLVYGNDGHTIRTLEELQTRITNAFEVMKREREVLMRVNENIRKRALLCIENQGHHFQQFL